MLKLVDRYIFAEFLMALSVGTLLIAGVFVGTDEYRKIMSLICDCGVEPKLALTISALEMPGIFVWCLPAGVMMATLVVLFRQSRDSELLALQCAGVSTFRLMRPFLLLAAAACILSFTLTECIVPQARFTATRLLVIGALNCELPRTRNQLTFMEADESNKKLNKIVLVGNYLRKQLQNVLIFDLSNPEVVKLIWSQAGVWNRGQWNLINGHIYNLYKEAADKHTSHFESMVVDGISKRARTFEGGGPLPQETSTSELRRQIKALEAHNKPVPPALKTNYLRRYSQPAACILVALAAFPLALTRRRSRTAICLVYGGILLFAYFLLAVMAIQMGELGILNPWIAAWMPGALLSSVGLIILFIRTRIPN
ncbi:MAG TPA: LptF/LptG family permease [Candidatus Obscuribacterales bacterium]